MLRGFLQFALGFSAEAPTRTPRRKHLEKRRRRAEPNNRVGIAHVHRNLSLQRATSFHQLTWVLGVPCGISRYSICLRFLFRFRSWVLTHSYTIRWEPTWEFYDAECACIPSKVLCGQYIAWYLYRSARVHPLRLHKMTHFGVAQSSQ